MYGSYILWPIVNELWLGAWTMCVYLVDPVTQSCGMNISINKSFFCEVDVWWHTHLYTRRDLAKFGYTCQRGE
jgi:hypothetical protein